MLSRAVLAVPLCVGIATECGVRLFPMASPLRPDSDASPFAHPGDLMDADPAARAADAARALVRSRIVRSALPASHEEQPAQGAGATGDFFLQIITDFVPFAGNEKYSARTCYLRFVACVFAVAPDVARIDDLHAARELGISLDQFLGLRRRYSFLFGVKRP